MNDWRGTPLRVGDHVAFPYAWGGQALAMAEGQITDVDEEANLLSIDLWYDSGTYLRKRPWVYLNPGLATKVEPR